MEGKAGSPPSLPRLPRLTTRSWFVPPCFLFPNGHIWPTHHPPFFSLAGGGRRGRFEFLPPPLSAKKKKTVRGRRWDETAHTPSDYSS